MSQKLHFRIKPLPGEHGSKLLPLQAPDMELWPLEITGLGTHPKPSYQLFAVLFLSSTGQRTGRRVGGSPVFTSGVYSVPF